MNFRYTMQKIILLCFFTIVTLNTFGQQKLNIDVLGGVIINPLNRYNFSLKSHPEMYYGESFNYYNYHLGLQFNNIPKFKDFSFLLNLQQTHFTWEYHQLFPWSEYEDSATQRERSLTLWGSQIGVQYAKNYKQLKFGFNANLNYFIVDKFKNVKGFIKLNDSYEYAISKLVEQTPTGELIFEETGKMFLYEEYNSKKLSLIPELFARYYYSSNYFIEAAVALKFWGNRTIYQKQTEGVGILQSGYIVSKERIELLNITIKDRWVYPKISLGYSFGR